jgi:hypothetical protein
MRIDRRTPVMFRMSYPRHTSKFLFVVTLPFLVVSHIYS